MKFFLSIVVIIFYIILVGPVEKFARTNMVAGTMITIPSEQVVDIFALEYKNLIANLLFFDAITYVGGMKTGRMSLQEGEWLYSILNTSSYLNPYSRDPYYLGQSVLTWEANLYEQANLLLERGMQYRDKEWQFPFFIGFNYFYFMNNSARGAEYIKIARDKPESPTMVLTTLASRLYYRSGRTNVAILILKDALKHETDESVKKIYAKRIEALEGVMAIEEAVEKYLKLYSKRPKSIDMLIKAGLLKSAPIDPYGGRYYIDNEGNVRSTSDFK